MYQHQSGIILYPVSSVMDDTIFSDYSNNTVSQWWYLSSSVLNWINSHVRVSVYPLFHPSIIKCIFKFAHLRRCGKTMVLPCQLSYKLYKGWLWEHKICNVSKISPEQIIQDHHFHIWWYGFHSDLDSKQIQLQGKSCTALGASEIYTFYITNRCDN